MVAEVHLHAAAADRRACGDAEGGDDSKGGDLPAVRGSCVTRARFIGGVGIRRAVRPHVARPSERTSKETDGAVMGSFLGSLNIDHNGQSIKSEE